MGAMHVHMCMRMHRYTGTSFYHVRDLEVRNSIK